MRYQKIAIAASGLLLMTACSSPTGSAESAEDFPSETVKIIVPFAPGGSLDSNARLLAECLNESGGQWIVENQEGGGGTIGVNNMLTAQPDGHTLAYVSSSGVALTPLQNTETRYTKDDLRPISMLTKAPAALLVREDSPYQTAEEFFDAAEGGENLSIATTGALGLYQLIVTELAKAVPVTPVPFDGTAPAVTAALGGNADAVMAEVSGSTLEHIESGRLRVLATGASEPVDFLPDAPTLESLGYDLPQSDNYGLLVSGTEVDSAVTEVINQKVTECANSDDVKNAVGEDFVLTPPLSGEEAQSVINEATTQYEQALEGQR